MGWSGGKDSAYCLERAVNGSEHEVVELFTTVSGEFERVSFHGLRTDEGPRECYGNFRP